jgi:hypothetical protein
VDVWDESPLPPPGRDARPTTDVPTPVTAGSGGADGGASPPTAPPDADPPPEPRGERAQSGRIAGVPAWALLALVGVISIGLTAALILRSDDDGTANGRSAAGVQTVTLPSPPAATTTPAAVITNPPEATRPAAPSTTTATTISPTTTTPTTATTATTTTTSPTTSPSTAAPTTTSTAPTTTVTTTPAEPTTVAPTTTTRPSGITVSEPTTVVDDAGRSLTVTPRRDACSSGPDCLVVAFTIDGFAQQPDEFVCEFSSGSRYASRFSQPSVDPACSTLDIPDSIVVEVDGLRSEPATITD